MKRSRPHERSRQPVPPDSGAAAGDFEGFIRAEVIGYPDSLACNGASGRCKLISRATTGSAGAMTVDNAGGSTYIDVSKIDWEPTPFPGVWTKRLYSDASGRMTVVTRMEPGARLPDHRHVGLEQSFVLEGSLVDADGVCTAGNYVWRRAGSVHTAWSPDGCIVLGIFDKPNEFLA